MKKEIAVLTFIVVSFAALWWASVLLVQNAKAFPMTGISSFADYAFLLLLPAAILIALVAPFFATPGKRLIQTARAAGIVLLALITFLGVTLISNVIVGAIAFYAIAFLGWREELRGVRV